MVSRYTTLVPSLGLRIGPACEASFSAGMRRERVPPHRRKKERKKERKRFDVPLGVWFYIDCLSVYIYCTFFTTWRNVKQYAGGLHVMYVCIAVDDSVIHYCIAQQPT